MVFAQNRGLSNGEYSNRKLCRRLHGRKRYDYMDVIGTTPGKEEVVNVWNTFSRVEPGAETE